MEKLSYYTISSDPINSQKDRVLFNSRTSSTLLVNESIYNNLIDGTLEKIDKNTSEELKRTGFLVNENEDELKTVVNENIEAIEADKMLYIVIQPSSNCQLGCYYCGQTHTKGNINSEVYNAIINRVTSKCNDNEFNHLEVGWFGSEPLIAINEIREVTQRLKGIAESHEMTYASSVVTNGLSLTPSLYKELANELGVVKIEVTLDGPEQYHDQHRYYKNKSGSFNRIFNNLINVLNLDDFEKYKCEISVRCNVDKKNWEGVSELIDLLADNELHKKLAYFYCAGVYSWSGNDANKNSLTKEEFAEKEIEWLIQMYQRGFSPFPLRQRQKNVCMAVSPNSELYDPKGNIFNCTEVSLAPGYEDGYKLGNVLNRESESIPRHKRHFDNWNENLLKDNYPCHSCKILPVCGGQCPKSWEEGIRACPSIKFNLKDRLALSYAIAAGGKEIFNSVLV